MKNNMIFLSNSIDDPKKDIIGFDTYVEKLNSAINKNAQMIAITSPFGSGKTSIIELLRKKRINNTNEKFIFVQMWSELNTCKPENKICELHKNFLYQIASGISRKKGTYINRRLSNNYGLLKLHVNRTAYLISLIIAILCAVFGWLIKEHSDFVLDYIPCIDNIIQYIPGISLAIAVILLIIVLTSAEIIFSSKKSESQRIIEADEIIDLYRNEIMNKQDEKYIIVVEDLDRTDDGHAVIQFLKELRKYYTLSTSKALNSQENSYDASNVVFIVNVKPETILNKEINDENEKILPESNTDSNEKQDDKIEIRQQPPSLYSKLFDYVLCLQTINVTDYDTVLCGLLEENKNYIEKHSLKSPSGKLSDIPGMQWIIRGNHLGIREVKNRLNIASTIFETLKERFPKKNAEIEFQKCAIVAYLITEFELEFSKTDDTAFDKLIELYLLGKLDLPSAQEILPTNSEEYIKIVIDLVKAKLINTNYKMYFYNYPKNSIIYSLDETNIQNAILYGTTCENFKDVSNKVVESDSNVVKKSLEKIRRLGLPLPDTVVKNEILFLEALKHEYELVLGIFKKMSDNDSALDNNIKTIVDILKFDSKRDIYNQKIISDFCVEWENCFSEDHLFKLRATLSACFGNEIVLFEKLFFGTHNVITIKEMESLTFEQALALLNVKSSNFSVSHVRYIVNRFKQESGISEEVTSKIRAILIFSCKVFKIKNIADDILDYMIATGTIVEELENSIWCILKEDPIDSDNEDGITYEIQNEIFQKYKALVNCVPVSEISEIVLSHISDFDEFDNPYSYNLAIGKKLYENGYFLMYTLVCLQNDSEVDFSDVNIIESQRNAIKWFSKHLNEFLLIRRQIMKKSMNLKDYLFCFSADLPMVSKEEWNILVTNRSVKITDLLDFFPSKTITTDAVKYICRHFNNNHINNNKAYNILTSILKYNDEIINCFFETIDFSRSILYYTFSENKKTEIKKHFTEALQLDTTEGKLRFMEQTKCLDIGFEYKLIGKINSTMEARYVNLIKQRKYPRNIWPVTITNLKAFTKFYDFGDQTGVNVALFEQKEYEYFVVSTTRNSKKFTMLDGELRELIWPTYMQIFCNPSHFPETAGYMKKSKDFLNEIVNRGVYTTFNEACLESLSIVKQDEMLVRHIFERGNSFAIKYFGLLKDGFVDKETAKKFIELLSLSRNITVLKSDSVRNRVYDMLESPTLKAKFTTMRKSCGCKY